MSRRGVIGREEIAVFCLCRRSTNGGDVIMPARLEISVLFPITAPASLYVASLTAERKAGVWSQLHNLLLLMYICGKVDDEKLQ